MLTGQCNDQKSKPPPPLCPLCFRTGNSAVGCQEYVVTKRGYKPNGQLSRSRDNSGIVSDNAGGRTGSRRKPKHRTVNVKAKPKKDTS